MKHGSNSDTLDLHLKKKKNISKIKEHLILKSPISHRLSHAKSTNQTLNLMLNESRKENKEKRNLYKISKEQLTKLKIQKYKKLILPSLSPNPSSYRSTINSKKNNNTKENKKPKIFKIKKRNLFSLSSFSINKNNNNKTLKILYNEDYIKKRNLERYKKKNNKNITNFSFEKYNKKLLKLSHIDISEDNFKIFKKYMLCIENAMKGRLTQNNNKYNKLYREVNMPKIETSQKNTSLSENKN